MQALMLGWPPNLDFTLDDHEPVAAVPGAVARAAPAGGTPAERHGLRFVRLRPPFGIRSAEPVRPATLLHRRAGDFA